MALSIIIISGLAIIGWAVNAMVYCALVSGVFNSVINITKRKEKACFLLALVPLLLATVFDIVALLLIIVHIVKKLPKEFKRLWR